MHICVIENNRIYIWKTYIYEESYICIFVLMENNSVKNIYLWYMYLGIRKKMISLVETKIRY